MEITNNDIVCNLCSKTYKRMTAYNKHALYCELLHKSKAELNNQAEDEDAAPSYKDLCSVIKTLISKTNKLEKELVIIKKQLPKSLKNNNLDYIDYLTKTITNPVQFDNWIDNLTLNDSHIDIILHNKSYTNSIYEIIHNLLEINKDVVLKSFSGSNQIYIYDKCLWKEMNVKNWNIIINKIVLKSHNQYSKWKLNNINSKISIEKQVLQILGNKSNKSLFKNVKKLLLEKIQEEIEL